MADDKNELVQAIIDGYANSETLAATEIQSDDLPAVLKSLRQDRQRIKADVKRISREVAPDVDGWIEQAQKLQADIEVSKATAREIVQQAEAASSLSQTHLDFVQKSQLLEAEVLFTQNLDSTLNNIKNAIDKLYDGQEAAAHGHPARALDEVEAVEAILVELRPVENTTVVDLLVQRVNKLRATLAETIERWWDLTIDVDHTNSKICFRHPDNVDADAKPQLILPMAELEELSLRLNLLHGSIARSCRRFTHVILKPRLEIGADGSVAQILFRDHEMSVSGRTTSLSCSSLLDDIVAIVRTLNNNLPPGTSVALSELLMPTLITYLLSHWLMPSIPTSLEASDGFQILMIQVEKFAAELESIGWNGSAQLQEWVEQGPRNWLASRREESLGAVRSVLAERMYYTSTAERVETQAISQQDAVVAQQTPVDEWDNGWKEHSAPVSPAKSRQQPQEDEDFDAWAPADSTDRIPPEPANGGSSTTNKDEDDEGDAWGWNDQDASTGPSSPVAARVTVPRANGLTSEDKSAQTHLTLKETYTITGAPDALRDLILQITHDAEKLRSPEYEESPIASAAATLYTLPTLVLAGFRALAPSYYTSLVGGNMFMYNDSMRLASELREFLSVQVAKESTSSLSRSAWPSVRMKLDLDIAALEGFARRTYGKEMESQRVILRDLLDGAQGFANCTEAPFAAECDNSITAVVDRIREVKKQWAPILSGSALLQSLGSLLSTVTSKMINEIEDLGDISEAESQRLRHFCNEVSTLSDLFTGRNAAAPEESRDMTAMYTSNWIKFQYLSEILESSLVDIKYFWNETDLKLEFGAEELVDLIEALFADTDHRRRAIADIRR